MQNIQPYSHIHSLDIANIILTYFGYKNVTDKGYAEIFYKMKSFVFFLLYICEPMLLWMTINMMTHN